MCHFTTLAVPGFVQETMMDFLSETDYLKIQSNKCKKIKQRTQSFEI